MIRPLVAAAAAALLLSCGGEEIEPMPTVDGVPEEARSGFAIRPALSEPVRAGCEADLPLDEPGRLCDLDGLAIEVGPAAVIGGVVAAQAVELREGSWGLRIELDPDSASALDELTRDAASSQSRVAVVIGGAIVSAPTIAGVVGAGALQIAGDWSQQLAQELADRVVADRALVDPTVGGAAQAGT